MPKFQLLATVYPTESPDRWLVLTPEGFFDGTPGEWKRVIWRLSNTIFDTATPEQFFSEFYYPGCLKEVLEKAKPLHELLRERGDARAQTPTLSSKDRRLPIIHVESLPEKTDQRSLDILVDVAESKPGIGPKDVRLFCNDRLVRRWQGSQQSGKLTAKGVLITAGENRFTAYAFNHDNVKSEDAPSVTVSGSDSLKRQAVTHILAIGIDKYQDPSLNLNLAVADARAYVDLLGKSLSPISSEVKSILLINEEATRDGILRNLSELARTAQPEDTVIVTYAGHGALEKGRFSLIPADCKNPVGGISDLDLHSVFAGNAGVGGIQARKLVLVLDACHSGAALDSEESRQGPMNSPGLAQLAYEKGMEIITASQSQQTAMEVRELHGKSVGHGLLTYVLLMESLKDAPRASDGLYVRSWLDFAAARVPKIQTDESSNHETDTTRGVKRVKQMNERAVQSPRVFHPRFHGVDWRISP